MALPVKTNQAAVTGERQENDMPTTETAINLATATQTELETYIEEQNLTVDALANQHMDGLATVGSAQRGIAAIINQTFSAKAGQRNWFDVEYRETGDLASAWAPHRKQILDLYKAKKHVNPSEALREIKKKGYELIHGKKKKGANSNTRDIYKRYHEELVSLYKAGINPENEETIKTHVESAKITTALEHITKALIALGKLPEAN
ncbi:MAG: hypothetical protein CMA72_01615 [Euryarchaeota archaeon]|nr:hypothetical protein [Euryarchaeota archaeon]